MGKSQNTIQVKILTENGTLFNGSCVVLFVPTKKEEIAIMPYHTPFISTLTEGVVRIKDDTGNKEITKCKTGIVYVGENEATVLVTV